MIAVVEIGGNQFTVKKGDVIEVDNINTDEKTYTTSPLLVSDEAGEDTKIGTPTLEGNTVTFNVVEHKKGDKIKVFKMKAKKRYSRTRGFRPHLTVLEVADIA